MATCEVSSTAIERTIEHLEYLLKARIEAERRLASDDYDDWYYWHELAPYPIHANAVTLLLHCIDNPRITELFDQITPREGPT
jgi:hypothetical protein